jgi:D-serine deaminase-like pyridoxal phosphate-dependent protein
MRRLHLLFVLAFASCATPDSSSDAPSDHLIVHVANAVPFDRLDYHFAAPQVTALDITDFHVAPLRSTAQWDEWAIAGHGWTDVSVDAFAGGAIIASGALHITDYIDKGNGLFLADVTLQLAPVP